MKAQSLLFTLDVAGTLRQALATIPYDKLFVLLDTHTAQYALPMLGQLDAHAIVIEAGDTHKEVAALAHVWLTLSSQGATRHSLLLNVGGGMVTDLGGFAAATFKRGIAFINIPTTLLGAVDAAVGGKTGINFNHLKNEIGAFAPARSVIISTQFFATLDTTNRLSGYAEMLKHALLTSPEALDTLLHYNIETGDTTSLLPLLKSSVEVKERIVAEDPTEQGIRKALNLGHTYGHAFESHSHRRGTPIAHGYAVAWGLICELLLSHLSLHFPIDTIRTLAQYVEQRYGAYPISCKEYDELYTTMQHDKKNESGRINFTLLRSVGEIEINQHIDKEKIFIALDLYRDLFHL